MDVTRAGRGDRYTRLTLAAGSGVFFGPDNPLMFRLSPFQECAERELLSENWRRDYKRKEH